MVTIRSGLVQRIEKCQRLEDRFILGDRAFYQGNWLMRAAANGGIYGNDSVEAKKTGPSPDKEKESGIQLTPPGELHHEGQRRPQAKQ